jgi:hypothetical protein
MIVIRAEECMGENATIELVRIFAALKELRDLPMDTLDRNSRVRSNLALPAVSAVRGRDNDGGVGNGSDGTETGFEMASEKIVKVFVAHRRDNIFFHIVVWGSSEGGKCFVGD